MLYDAFEIGQAWLQSASAAARIGANWLNSPVNPLSYTGAGEMTAAALDVFSHATATRDKPAFGLEYTVRDGRRLVIREEAIDSRPFGTLMRFVREGAPKDDPKLLIVAPMSGHYATLLRGTVERLLPRHDVYITDWANANLVPLAAGHFDLDDYITHVIDWFRLVSENGERALHVLGVCQPAVPVYAATALLNARHDPAAPATITLMGGPIDTRLGMTAVNRFALDHSLEWFRRNVIHRVPPQYAGYGRHVYPGFLQLSGFMSMNLDNHIMSHWRMFRELVKGDEESVEATKKFYEEYRSVADLTAEFYLQTVDTVFHRHLLPKGEMVHRGERVDPSRINRTAILAIEGERDDISGIGQTKAALDVATGLDDSRKAYHLIKGVGHYGIFNGGKWRRSIAPLIEAFIRTHEARETTPKTEAKAPAAPKTVAPKMKAKARKPVRKAATKATTKTATPKAAAPKAAAPKAVTTPKTAVATPATPAAIAPVITPAAPPSAPAATIAKATSPAPVAAKTAPARTAPAPATPVTGKVVAPKTAPGSAILNTATRKPKRT